jgi:hypothetical protein
MTAFVPGIQQARIFWALRAFGGTWLQNNDLGVTLNPLNPKLLISARLPESEVGTGVPRLQAHQRSGKIMFAPNGRASSLAISSAVSLIPTRHRTIFFAVALSSGPAHGP